MFFRFLFVNSCLGHSVDQCFDGKDHSNDVDKATNAQNTAVICSPSLQMPENKVYLVPLHVELIFQF